MATPKRRHTKSRRDKRRAHWKRVSVPSNTSCPQCHKPKLPHRVCPHCGTYKGRDVLDFE